MVTGKAGPPPDMAASGMWLGAKAGAGAAGYYLLGLAVWTSVDVTLRNQKGGLSGLEFFPELLLQFISSCEFLLVVGCPIGLTYAIIIGVVTGRVIGESFKRMWAFMTVSQAWVVGSLVCILAAFIINVIAASIILLPHPSGFDRTWLIDLYRLFFGLPSLIYIVIGGWLSARFYSQMKKNLDKRGCQK